MTALQLGSGMGMIVLAALGGACSGRGDSDSLADSADAGAATATPQEEDPGGGAADGAGGPGVPARGAVPFPPDNASTSAKIELGRLLFWDPILSGDRDVACASCHHPDFAYGDGQRLSLGTGGRHAARNALTVLDAAWNGATLLTPSPAALDAPMFWDSRVRSLEAQAKGPLSTLEEMRGPSFDAESILPEVVSRLSAIPDYSARFDAVFGAGGLDIENVARALATFERSLVDHGSSYDRYAAGDATALSAAQKRGLDAFAASGCTGCHSGPMFSDYALHRLGGPAGPNAFRTPSLRNVMRTAPYLQDGSLASLDQVFDFYRRVDHDADPKLRAVRAPQGAARSDIAALFTALSDGDFDRTIPAEVPSGLTVGGTAQR